MFAHSVFLSFHVAVFWFFTDTTFLLLDGQQTLLFASSPLSSSTQSYFWLYQAALSTFGAPPHVFSHSSRVTWTILILFTAEGCLWPGLLRLSSRGFSLFGGVGGLLVFLIWILVLKWGGDCLIVGWSCFLRLSVLWVLDWIWFAFRRTVWYGSKWLLRWRRPIVRPTKGSLEGRKYIRLGARFVVGFSSWWVPRYGSHLIKGEGRSKSQHSNTAKQV